MLVELLEDQAHRELADALAAEVLGHVERPQLGGLRLRVDRVALLGGETPLQEEVVLERHQLPLAELPHHVDDHAELVGDLKVHPGPSVANVDDPRRPCAPARFRILSDHL